MLCFKDAGRTARTDVRRGRVSEWRRTQRDNRTRGHLGAVPGPTNEMRNLKIKQRWKGRL